MARRRESPEPPADPGPRSRAGASPMRRAIAVHLPGHWPEEAAVETVTLAFLDRHRRRIRLVSDTGGAFLLDLPRAARLADGDGLELAGGGYIRVRAAAEPVLEIATAEPATLLRIAWHLGNRHLPVQIVGDRLCIREDPVIGEMVVGLGGHIERREAPFDPEIGAYEHAHSREVEDHGSG